MSLLALLRQVAEWRDPVTSYAIWQAINGWNAAGVDAE